jgi:fatty-acyl-CoA synthase
MFIAELALDDFDRYDLSSLRTGIMAGSPCPVEVMKQCVDKMHMSEVTICYGMTETSPVSTQTSADDPLDKRVGSVGRVHPHVEVAVIDPEKDLVVGYGEPGELCTRGYSVMLGYWNDPERTAEAIDAERWMHTGDLAVMDVEGYVNIVGRIKDMIIRGGNNIYATDVEAVILEHPDVQEAAVIGVPHQVLGEDVGAFVVCKPGASLDNDALTAFCAERLADYKRPRKLWFVAELPRNATGKVMKHKLREQVA